MTALVPVRGTPETLADDAAALVIAAGLLERLHNARAAALVRRYSDAVRAVALKEEERRDRVNAAFVETAEGGAR